MKKREFLYDDGENFIIWSTNEDVAEIIVVYGDRVLYYVPNSLIDNVLFTQMMQRMNLGKNDQDNIRNYIYDLYDAWKEKYVKNMLNF